MLTATCANFYHYVPLEAGYSPPCNPTGVNVELHCSGYSPTTRSTDLVWMWSPDAITPYTEATFFFHFNWNPSSSVSIPSSGPYAGFNYHETNLLFVSSGVTADIMGYYACIFVHRDGSTTPQFDFTPAILLNNTPGVTTPCPAFSGLSFAEYFTPDICAERVETITTIATQTTLTFTTSITFETTTEIAGNKKCCGLAVYVGIASALVTSSVICILGATAFFISKIIKSAEQRKRGKIYVG